MFRGAAQFVRGKLPRRLRGTKKSPHALRHDVAQMMPWVAAATIQEEDGGHERSDARSESTGARRVLRNFGVRTYLPCLRTHFGQFLDLGVVEEEGAALLGEGFQADGGAARPAPALGGGLDDPGDAILELGQ